MFIGEFKYSVDEKGRLPIPVKFRDKLVSGLVLTRGLDGCLWVYDNEEWGKIAEEISKLPVTSKNARAFSRFILSGAMDLKLDKSGRVNLPQYLSEYAQIDGRVVITGMHNRLEIWSEVKWNEFKKEMEEKSEEVAEQLSEIGF